MFINFANNQTDLLDTEVDVPAELTYATQKFEHSQQSKWFMIEFFLYLFVSDNIH